MDSFLLDTDIVSEVLKQRNATVQQNAAAYLRQHQKSCFSSVTRFELIRWYKVTNATTQLRRFQVFCQNSLILPLTEPIFDRAADLWAYGRIRGHPIEDADVLIGATALEHGRILVTGNEAHFNWMPGLTVDNWRR